MESVEKTFGTQRALKGVSLRCDRGEVVGLLGPNGAGKSTLMRLITGYLPATSGRVEVCGFDVSDARRGNRQSGARNASLVMS